MRLGEWDAIRGELLSMAEEDLQVRSELAKDGSLFEGYHPRMRATHDANATRLQSILDSLGWPGERQVGHEAAEAAWLIVQHAIAQPNLQRRALELLRGACRVPREPARPMDEQKRCPEKHDKGVVVLQKRLPDVRQQQCNREVDQHHRRSRPCVGTDDEQESRDEL